MHGNFATRRRTGSRRTLRRALTLTLGALLPSALLAGAPRLSPQAGNARPRALDQADSLFWAGQPARGLAVLERRIEDHPNDYEARWKAARAAAAVALLEPDPERQKDAFTVGIDHGREAVRLAPDGVDGLYWLIANVGRRSFLLSPWGAARAGQEVYELSMRVLALDSTHAGAHDALGKLAIRVMSISAVERFIARAVVGNEALRTASWEVAERHLRRAVELDPTWPMLHLDLGEVYLHTGRFDLATAEYQQALELPARYPGDNLFWNEALYAMPFAREHRKP